MENWNAYKILCEKFVGKTCVHTYHVSYLTGELYSSAYILLETYINIHVTIYVIATDTRRMFTAF